MGYVRMVRSGGMQFCSDAIKFVPDLQNIPNFEQLVNESADQKTELSNETKVSAQNLDRVISDLSKHFAEGSDYFDVLVKVFQGPMRGEKQAHLRNFYAIGKRGAIVGRSADVAACILCSIFTQPAFTALTHPAL